MTALLPYGRHGIDDDDIAAVEKVLRGEFLTTGPAVAAFEQALAEAVGAPGAVVCSSGTAALHLAAMSIGLGPGDAAVVPAITFLATANAVRLTGAEVVFADVDPDTGLMGADHVDAAMGNAGGQRVRAVFPVHLAGQPAAMDEIAGLADARGLVIVEDACHAIGSTYEARDGGLVQIGQAEHGGLAAFSFHPVKTVAMGEGGALTGRNEALLERVRRLRNHGMTREPDAFTESALAFDDEGAANPWHYEMPEPGLNYRASDIHCALGLSQLGKLERLVARRRALAAAYDEGLAALAPLVRPLARRPGCAPAWHLYVALIDFAAAGTSRRRVMEVLRADGIGSQVHYIPVHLQPYYRQRCGAQDLPGAMRYFERCLSLPLFPGMADGDVDRVVRALSRAIRDGG
ncbi:MAG: UDP-4-amino-4,6-dideoxy-N-acetyl-beta-L-altrosamine transaminase [Alphaproteobacteria bacterium]|nr:UDP-4-amino-4,6-dideoxy-N-acetyl-beta-L-altrosamine transaminase [Alphaproteobacteria bacterium]